MKIYRVQREVLVAVCDSSIVGNTYRSDGFKIEISEEFYGKEEVGEEEVRKALKSATIANISGEKAVKLAIEAGIIDEENVLRVGDCWHAQMVVL
ncbi:hypothetical protein Asulf_00617 [Archaeoglobus sulfaticallidus PM70-1]|uniref:DUF424 domain-containing protein n=1 Tax=Archaeoglobus sulfaticallidus PM70-1 TaxID=387631 RepID=N0BJI2_9EURY|nr:DUF424 family protein [Archaeoglobus sulfaticallidus]AGK60636.1 hypothetical protein Asulf_00617 [Archaeoglobus sulfaticallidus PM70-1]